MVAGLQVPVMLLVDVAGSGGAALFWHSGPICVKVGVIWLVITISIVAVVAHWFRSGVKVYVVVPAVDVLIVAFQVPVIPLLDGDGNGGAVLF